MTRIRSWTASCVLLASCLVASFLPGRFLGAQSLAWGALSGRVVDEQGLAVRDAEIRLRDELSGATRVAISARDGTFRFSLLSPSNYSIEAEALGYRPLVYLVARVTPGSSPSIPLTLRRATPPVAAVDTIRASAVRRGARSWLLNLDHAELAGGRRLASDMALLSSRADANSVEGLSWRYAGSALDGVQVAPTGAPGSDGSLSGALSLPSRALLSAMVGGTGFDVETGGSGVGITAYSLRGGSRSTLRGSAFGGTADAGGAFTFGGPLQRDTAQAIIGLEYVRSEIARPAWVLPTDVDGQELIAVASDSYGVDLGAYRLQTARLDERATAFGRLDWRLGDRSAVTLRGAGSRLVSSDPPHLGEASDGFGSRQEALAIQFGAEVVTRITEHLTSELRVAGDVGESTADEPGVARTLFAGRGLTVGGEVDEPFTDKRTTPRVSAAMHWDLGDHRLKWGLALASHRSESDGGRRAAGEFSFGDDEDFQVAAGAWRGLESGANSGNFRMLEQALFVQDGWAVSDGLSLSLGLRFDTHRLPAGAISPNAAWLATSGLDNTSLRSERTRLAPRFGLRWELGDERQWVLEGGAGVYNDLPDHHDIAEALAFDEGIEVRSGVGALGGWPGAPSPAAAPSRGNTLAMLGPDFEGPRTRRMTLGLQRSRGAWSASLGGTYRQTDFLARRRDLNLPVAPSGTDQYGRPLYGTLQQVGALLVAQPGSNRRFAGFDAATAIEVSGFSEYWGATVGIERVMEGGLSAGVEYTYSRTRDNLASDRDAMPLLAGSSGSAEWAEGIANTDAPHRLVAALDWSLTASGSARFAAIYRLSSGVPFTAGFKDGVDADGDGASGNEPAFVDASLTGMSALLSAHACLRRSVAAFVMRNDCRGDAQHRVDVRASFRLPFLSGSPVELVVDALDLIPQERGRVDRALYLVDRNGNLTTDAGTGVTAVPLIVNPAFGSLIADRATGPLFRAGLRIGR